MSFVLVGDLHGKKDNLQESFAIIKWCIEQAKSRNSNLVLLGDLLNDFGVIRVEMLLFVDEIFRLLEQFIAETGKIVVILKGNHDENSQATMTYLSLWANRNPSIHIVLSPMQLENVLFVPFIRSHEQFIAITEPYTACNILVCHQEFDGCMYENGFYSPHGFKLDQLPSQFRTVVSGHIHKTQQIGAVDRPVIFIGIPRHLTKSDIEHIPVIGITSDFKSIEYVEVPDSIAPRFHSLTIDESYTKPKIKELMKITDRSRFYIDLVGSTLFIKKILREHDWTGFKLKTTPTDAKVTSNTINESEGIKMSFNKFILSYADKNGLGQNEIKAIFNIYRELTPDLVS